MMYKQALQIAYNAHRGQVRRGGNVPYIVHPLRVSQAVSGDLKKAVAVLHDVVEDTDITLQYLAHFFPYEVVRLVDILTKREGDFYFTYIDRILGDDVATEIKIADIVDNLSDSPNEKDSMIDRYDRALDKLINKKYGPRIKKITEN